MFETHRPVLSKRDFAKRYEAGEFGNHAPTWNTLSEFLASGYNGLIHLRNRIAGGKTWYNVAPNDVDLYWQEALNSGLKPSDLYLSAMCPTEKTLIQGEIMQSEHGGYNLYYTQVAKPMREALKESSKTTKGTLAMVFLGFYLDPNSIDWIRTLLTRYPGHVIEFSTFSVNWGTLPGYNTVIWEVRNY